MKITILYLALMGISYNFIYAQNVHIPDINFKTYLLNNVHINTDNDAEISVAEANAFDGEINVANNINIQSLDGLESFINITGLDCSNTSITSLDIRSNSNLRNLNCSHNNIDALVLTENTILESINASHTFISEMQLQLFSALLSIDVSYTNISRIGFYYSRALSYVNLSNNALLTHVYLEHRGPLMNTTCVIYNTPAIECIHIDNYPAFGRVTFYDENNSAYIPEKLSLDCVVFNGPEISVEEVNNVFINLYPNPAKSIINIEAKSDDVIQIVNVLGAVVSLQNIFTGNNEINVEHLSKGIYFVKSSNGNAVKFVKE